MRITVLTIICMLLHCGCIASGNIMFEKANQLYRNHNYQEAASLYEQLLHDGYCSADIYYNTGNAYYRLNKIGMAIWNYQKAINISNKKNYRDNLILAKRRIKEPIAEQEDIFFIRWWRNMYTLFSVNSWAILALVSFLIYISISSLQLLKKLVMNNLLTKLFLFVCIVSLFFMGVAYYNSSIRYKAVVVENYTAFMNEQGKQDTIIHEGNIVTRLGIKKSQLYVQLSDGRKGYIDASAIKKL